MERVVVKVLEIPEAFVVARQIKETIAGKSIKAVKAAGSPHKFAFYYGDPQAYDGLLSGETITDSFPVGGMIEIGAGSKAILLSDGVNLRYHGPGEPRPQKHQLLIELDDGSAISATVQMYGGIWCFAGGEFDNKYYKVAKEKPSPLTEGFDAAYFERLISEEDAQKLSAKAFLATGQRIPGLGNGVLQDILWLSGIHPKRKILTLTKKEKEDLFLNIKKILKIMADKGGRDTEKDLFGQTGGYKTVMSKNHLAQPCPACGECIDKAAYMGGTVYFCPNCQKT